MLDRHEKIQTRAYALWETMGYPHGADWDHWLEAEKQVDGELLKSFKPKKAAAKAPAKAKVKKSGKAA
jgi:hypothetical protein